MKLAIDFGISYTKIAVQKNDQIYMLSDRGKLIPSIVSYDTENKQLGFKYDQEFKLNKSDYIEDISLRDELQRNPFFSLGSYELLDILTFYFAYLNNTYINEIENIDSIAINVANDFGLNSRKILIQALANAFHTQNISIIPDPMARYLGYYFEQADVVTGDILSITLNESNYECSFLTVAEDQTSIILESQFYFRNELFTTNAINEGILYKQAKNAGMYLDNKWQFDAILVIANDNSEKTQAEKKLINNYFSSLPIISPEDTQLFILKGLLSYLKSKKEQSKFAELRCIYPYKFFITTLDKPNAKINLTELPFDTTNLDLDINKNYKLFSISKNSEFNISADNKNFYVKIYEKQDIIDLGSENTNNDINLDIDLNISSHYLLLEIKKALTEVPDTLNLYLNLNEGSVELVEDRNDIILEGDKPEPFQSIQGYQALFDYMKESQAKYPEFINDFQARLDKINDGDLNHEKTLKFRLYALLYATK